jgi:polyhydroxyalkanoate synthesis regulator protein
LIRFYGDSMQMLVPSYLEFTIDKLTTDQSKFREQFASAFATGPTRQMFGSLEEQARKNMAIFSQALSMFSPFGKPLATAADTPQESQTEAAGKSDLDEMKRQLYELQKRLDGLSPKE